MTPKQRSVLSVICNKNPADGKHVDMQQLLELLDYPSSRDAVQFVIRSLVKKKLIVKLPHEFRRGKKRVVFAATGWGKQSV